VTVKEGVWHWSADATQADDRGAAGTPQAELLELIGARLRAMRWGADGERRRRHALLSQHRLGRRETKMPKRATRIFRFHCPRCGVLNTTTCQHCGTLYRFDPVIAPGEKRVKRHIWFGERAWERMVARAKVTPGINGPAEFIRMACDEVLSMPPHKLISV